MIERRLAEEVFNPDFMLSRARRVTRLSQLVEKFKENTERRSNIGEQTKVGYRIAADDLLSICGDISLNQVNRGFVEDMVLVELGQRYDSVGTIKSKMTAFRVIFSFALRNEYVRTNPFSGQVPRVLPGKPVWFREDEIKDYLAYWKDVSRPVWARTYFVTLLNTGNRMSEHLSLRWSKNIFLDERIIKFKGKGRYGGKERIVPLNDAAVSAFLEAHRKLGEDRVFWQVKSKEAVRSAWRMFQKRTGFRYKLHNTRSNHASWLIMAGESVEKVMQIHGWEDYETYKLYRGLSKEFLQSNRNLVNW